MLKSGLRWIGLSVIVIILDRITKYLAQKYLIAYSALPIFPGFNLELSYNKGAAFSFLHAATGWQVGFFGLIAAVVSIALLIWLSRLSWREYGLCIALSFILGGALGNLCDRLLYGHVIDFIQLYVAHFYWPTFNIADSAICLGALILVLQASFQKKSASY